MKCDVTKWEDQLEMFREAVKFSPTGIVDIVVANAGLAVLQDSVFTPESMNLPPLSNKRIQTDMHNSIRRAAEACLKHGGCESERCAIYGKVGIVLFQTPVFQGPV